MRLRYKLGLGIVVICIGLCLMMYQSYALWVVNLKGEENIVESGCFKIEFSELTSSISLSNTYPMYDERGLSQIPYTFKIKNSCSIASAYLVTLNTLTTNTITTNKMKFAIGTSKPTVGVNLGDYTSGGNHINTDTSNFQITDLDESIIIESGDLNPEEEITYQLYLWIDSESGNEVMGQSFNASLNIIHNAKYTEPKYCDSHGNTFACELLAKGETSELKFDDTEDKNLRYIGANPNNYVDLGMRYGSDIYYRYTKSDSIESATADDGVFTSLADCENGLNTDYYACTKVYSVGDPILWRVIGAMNHVEDQLGNKESRVKLVSESSIGSFSWNIDELGNKWNSSVLMKLLNPGYESESANNSLYWNATSGNCYIYDEDNRENSTTACDFSINGLNDTARSLIKPAKWYIGYVESIRDADGNDITDYYKEERTSSMIGYVGLYNPSDYSCVNANLEKDNIWLSGDFFQWTLNPSSENNYLWTISSKDLVPGGGPAYWWHSVTHPVVYLGSSVKKVSGEGTKENPFVLANE